LLYHHHQEAQLPKASYQIEELHQGEEDTQAEAQLDAVSDVLVVLLEAEADAVDHWLQQLEVVPSVLPIASAFSLCLQKLINEKHNLNYHTNCALQQVAPGWCRTLWHLTLGGGFTDMILRSTFPPCGHFLAAPVE